MKLRFGIFASLALIFAFPSFAQETREPVAVDELKLLGKGYLNKESGETLALACVYEQESRCLEARFVLFPAVGSSNTAEWIGTGLVIPYREESSEVDMAAFKDKFSRIFQNTVQKQKHSRAVLYTFLAVGTASSGVGLLVGIPSLGLTYTLTLFGITGGWNGFKASTLGQSANSLNSIYQDQRGWNWSSKPKKLRKEVFETLMNDLDHPSVWPKI